jgi:competence protein ComEC
MRVNHLVWAGAIVAITVGLAAAQAPKTLRIYVVDTEGGKEALFVTPSGQTALIDSGNPGGRDTDRLMAAIADAGVKRIDVLISTHYHLDHIGGMKELAARIPIGHYIDHGANVEPNEPVAGFSASYAELFGKAQHTEVKAGDRVPIADLDWRIVTSGGKPLKTPLAGGGAANAACATVQAKDANPTDENSQSVGSVIAFGQFRILDLADLLWFNENELMCPNNPIGTVDLYLVTHHGLDRSGSPAVVHAVRPRVAVMQNGTRKGANVEAMKIMRASPGLEDIWQLHWSHVAGIEQNSAGAFIANLDDPQTIAGVVAGQPAQNSSGAAHTPANWIKIVARQDGSFTVSNSRNGFSKTYQPRRRS